MGKAGDMQEKPKKVTIKFPDGEREVEPTGWRHDGWGRSVPRFDIPGYVVVYMPNGKHEAYPL